MLSTLSIDNTHLDVLFINIIRASAGQISENTAIKIFLVLFPDKRRLHSIHLS